MGVPWFLVGGSLGSAPDAAYVGPDDVRVVVRGMDGWIWRTDGDGRTYRPFVFMGR